MSCRQHTTSTPARKGAESTCDSCHKPILHDGTQWRWTYDIAVDKARKLRAIHAVNEVTGL